MAGVTLEKVNKLYENGFHAVHDLDLDIKDGEFLVLVGPSGCGKTTALRMVAGLEDISTGVMKIGDKVVNTLSPKDRDIAMVFQSYALYPHMTLRQNIGYGLRIRKMSKEETERRVNHAAEMLDLTHMLDRKPKQLSGGQRQRVAMGRAIVREPKVFLMDEPLSNLDAKLRVQMRADIAQIQRDLGTTTMYVTHDQVEAMTMGTRVAVMKLGVLQQLGEPQAIYDNPDNVFVAGFIGSPPMNMGSAVVTVRGEQVSLRISGVDLIIDPIRVADRPGLLRYHGKKIIVGVRSEDIYPAAIVPNMPEDQKIKVTVLLTEALGSEVIVRFAIDIPVAVTEDTKLLQKDAGLDDAGHMGSARDHTAWVAAFGPRAPIRAGDDIDIAIQTKRLHFFDPETSLAIRN
ncbi:ABC transporter ATP-binding protein [Acidothermaceae bacterium B102]|nr:ABC transporter ATP-binding protein [Acidothermaceae bacterium B102]